MTPSAVSQQLTDLARQLGVTLLEAQGRRVRLTDAAHLVLRHAEAVFAQLERADAELLGYLQGRRARCGSARSRPPSPRSWSRPCRSCAARTRGWRSRYGRRRRRPRTSCCPAGRRPRAVAGRARADPAGPQVQPGLAARRPAGRGAAGRPPAGGRAGAAAGRPLAGEPWIFGSSGPWSQITTARLRERRASSPNRRTRPPTGARSWPWSRRGWAWRWCPRMAMAGGSAPARAAGSAAVAAGGAAGAARGPAAPPCGGRRPARLRGGAGPRPGCWPRSGRRRPPDGEQASGRRPTIQLQLNVFLKNFRWT